MAVAGLVDDVARQHGRGEEARGDTLGVGEGAAAIVAHVDDEAAATAEGVEDLVEVRLRDAVGEAAVIDVSDVGSGQLEVAHATSDGVAGADVVALDVGVEVARIILEPSPVAGRVEGATRFVWPSLSSASISAMRSKRA